MKVSIEQVEKLKERTNVTYEEARDALQAADGDILEAVIALEKEGKTPYSTAAYSTNNSLPAMDNAQSNDANNSTNSSQNYNQDNSSANEQNTGQNFNQNNNSNNQYYNGNQYRTSSFGEIMRKFFDFCGRVIHAGNINHFKAHRFGRETFSIPVTILVLLLIFFLPITISVLIIALFFGYKYSFSGPNLGNDNINRAMNNVSDVAEDLKESFKTDNPNNDGNNDENHGK